MDVLTSGSEPEVKTEGQTGGKRHSAVGSRAQVWHGTAKRTPGGLLKKDLLMNKHGRIVSKAKSIKAKKEKRLEKAGYFTKKGKFGFVKKEGSRKSRKSTRKSRK
jgi:hypothetical protein